MQAALPPVFFEEAFWAGMFEHVQCEAWKQIKNTGIGTKLQQVLKLQQEQLKAERKIVNQGQRKRNCGSMN